MYAGGFTALSDVKSYPLAERDRVEEDANQVVAYVHCWPSAPNAVVTHCRGRRVY